MNIPVRWKAFSGAARTDGSRIEAVIKRVYETLLPRSSHALDGGANVGLHRRGLSGHLVDGQVIAVDTNEVNFKQLQLRTGTRTHLTRHLVAVHNDPKRTSISFNCSPSHPGRSGISRIWDRIAPGKVDYAETVTVPATTIDKLVQGAGWARLDFIKLDLEGGEFNALRGAKESLRHMRPLIVTKQSLHAPAFNGCAIEDHLHRAADCGHAVVGRDHPAGRGRQLPSVRRRAFRDLRHRGADLEIGRHQRTSIRVVSARATAGTTPNVLTMLQAYRKAREHGQFAPRRSRPRLAVLDSTPRTRLCATGLLKRHLLRGWPRPAQLQVHADVPLRVSAFQSMPGDLYAHGSDNQSVWPPLRSLVEFDPAVLYLRPTDDRPTLTVLQAVCAAVLGRPWVLYVMDDWLARAQATLRPAVAQAHAEALAWLLYGATHVLASSDKMGRLLLQRHGLPPSRAEVIHNYMPPAPRSEASGHAQAQRTLRYCGGLEPDMGRLVDADADVQSRALAVLLAGFGEDRFKAVNAPVRDWLLGHHPAP